MFQVKLSPWLMSSKFLELLSHLQKCAYCKVFKFHVIRRTKCCKNFYATLIHATSLNILISFKHTFLGASYFALFSRLHNSNLIWNWNIIAQEQGRRNIGRARGGAVKTLRAMETYEKQKIIYQFACYCSTTMLTSKIITEPIENIFQFNLDKP